MKPHFWYWLVVRNGRAKAIGFFLMLALNLSVAQAATFTVTSLNDSGAGSLRKAVLDANAAPGNDTIAFQSGLTGTIVLTSGEIAITDRVAINGPGANVLAVSGNQASRVFKVSGLGVTLQGLTIKAGKVNNDYGGGIDNSGFLTLNNMTLSDNAAGYGGGGINNTGSLTLSNIILSGNSANNGSGTGNGGGIFNWGSLTATRLTLSDNSAYGYGGGIHNQVSGSDVTVTIDNSILTTNRSSFGGGISNYSSILTVSNSTLSGNQATYEGGGIQNNAILTVNNSTLSDNGALGGGGIHNAATLDVSNSTLSGNLASEYGGGISNNTQKSVLVSNSTLSGNVALISGGGIQNYSGAMTLSNNLVVGNAAPTGKSIDLAVGYNGEITSQGYNLLGENGVPGVSGFTPAANDLVLAGSVSTAIGPLADNGGPTQTHALVAGSPAINAGNNALIPIGVTTDQRGAGFPRIVGGTVDIGAVEGAGGGSGGATFTVTASAGAGGAISPASATVNNGATATFTVTPNTGYAADVTGCSGTLAGNIYTTGPITANCMISASFHPNTSAFTVTASAGPNGVISPATQSIAPGATATFTVTPNTGYVATVAGCNGSLTSATYTTGPITAPCTVVAAFSPTAAASAPTITTSVLPDAIVGVPYAAVLTAIGGQYPYTYTATDLPPGLTLTTEGILRGTPTTGGAFAVAATVTDALGRRGSRGYVVTASAGLSLVTANLPDALVNIPYTQTLAAVGGQPSYIFTAAGLPTGLSLTPSGVLSGTPVERGVAAVQLTVTDTFNQQSTKNAVLTVRDFTFTEPNPEQPDENISGAAESCPTANIATRTLKLGDPGAPTTGPDGVTLPYGLLEITVTGCEPGQTVLALTTVYPEPLPPDAQYWKYGRTHDNAEPHWYVLPGAIIEGNAITLLIVDGDIGDADLAVDGNILDPGGPGITLNTIDGAVPAVLPISEPYRADFQARCNAGACPAGSVYDWSLAAGALPDGLTLTGAGAIATLSGTPTRVGRYPFTVQVLTRGATTLTSTQQSYTVRITDGSSDPAATTLITHYYVSILEREPEAEGLAYWQGLIAELQGRGQDAKPVFRDMANFFFNSPEYLGRNTTDRQFITNLYLTFFQREPDEDGYAFWLADLANHAPRNDVMTFFLYSQEFTDFMAALGF
ncbi:MAG: DUF4214 domain-containing protein [Candidatus Competibacteraceae bacterium]|nr:DUF4214 domain-containing protein [Candidatus Competibacteraceae bacterium]